MTSSIKVTYVDHMGDDLRPVNAARISFGASKEALEEKDIKLLEYLGKHSHLSPFEHCTLSVIIKCPLYIRSQIHRHRTFSYNEISRRYTSKDLEFYVPPIEDIRKQSTDNKQASSGLIDDSQMAEFFFKKANEDALHLYNLLLEKGVAREQARGVLPQNLMTEFYMTGNLRNWAHFQKLRLGSGAQSEVRVIAEQLNEILLDKFPVSYKILTSNQKTSD